MVAIKFITQLFDFNLLGKELIRSESEDIVLQEALLPVLSFLQLPGLLKFPFLFLDEGQADQESAVQEGEIPEEQCCLYDN